MQLLYDYILSRGTIIPINDYDEELLRHGDVAKHVTESIRLGTHEWEDLVPQAVRAQIKRLQLLGYREDKVKAKDAQRSNGAAKNGPVSKGASKDGAGKNGAAPLAETAKAGQASAAA